MSILHQAISRRAFLRLVARTTALTFLLRTRVSRSEETDQSLPHPMTYGAGAYGEGPYSGYQSYLPSVLQEGGDRGTLTPYR